MQGFFEVLTVEQVTNLLAVFAPLPPEETDLLECDGRVLAEDVVATEDLPPANRSAMDGYALRAADSFGGTENNPSYLQCVGHFDIQTPPDKELSPGQCAGIVTGGILPAGADAVVMVEYTHDMGGGMIEVRAPVAPGAHVMLRGEDARSGGLLLPAGVLLRPQEIGLLAALGITRLPVHKVPRVAIVSTGDELVAIHATPKPGQVRDVNSTTLACLVRRAGGTPVPLGLVPDELDALSERLRQALSLADLVLLSGGSSVGVRDMTLGALQTIDGARILCHGVALSPGKPLIIADVNGKAVWGLPGQVASAQVVMLVLGQAFIRLLQGRQNPFDQSLWPKQRAVLAKNIASRQGREDYVRVRLERNEKGVLQATPILGMSGLLRSLTDAHGLARIPASLEGLEAGALVDVLLF
ncbi:MAG: molybdopterin molybdotransferase MoeA [Deltaproteobacteria bacterium]|jgi:molybdopterin molybdotransferase|nr:molybdopterin molybdotransferase MoeA [Deltaproteobacteria bacterium]